MNRFGQQPKPEPKKESEDCEIKVRRDKEGKIVGLKRTGKCTKEDILAFKQQNNIEVE